MTNHRFPWHRLAWPGPGLVILLALACGDDPRADSEDADDDAAADPSAADSADSTDPPPPVPDRCERYLECIDAVRPDQYLALARKYGPDGRCWDAGPGEAAVCVDDCEDALGDLHRRFQTEEACTLCLRDDECDTVAGEFCFAGGCELRECGAGGAGPLCL